MALHNITYRDKEVDKLINAEMGKPYPLLKKLKIGGIGSGRFIVENFSQGLNSIKMRVSGIQYANIELRPMGIIVHVNKGLYNYAWTVTYYHLSIYNGEYFSIHSKGEYIQFNRVKAHKQNKKFINKLTLFKAQFSA